MNPSTNTSVIKGVTDPFPPTALQRPHAQTVRYSSSSYKIGYILLVVTLSILTDIKISEFGGTLPDGGVAL